ncbi:MAG: hypothetical protein IAF38_04255 [Bacteroidia bacterium]|nr:hypothetical protein [Bacteroidia bacterium]
MIIISFTNREISVVRKFLVVVSAVLLFSCGSKSINENEVQGSDSVFSLQSSDSSNAKSYTEIDSSVLVFFNDPEKKFREDNIQKNFRIIVLSNLAEYILNFYFNGHIPEKKAEEYLDKIVTISLSDNVKPNYENGWEKKQLKEDGLFLGHFNIILGIYKSVSGSDKHKNLNLKISSHLKKMFADESTANIRSWNNSSLRFPADNAAVLFSLFLYDKNFSDSLSRKPMEAWLAFMMTKGTNEKYGLHFSEVSAASKTADLPRGCALSFTICYMNSFAPKETKQLWERYKKEFLVEANGIAGFREWPKGIERKADADSGPIVFGIGTAASGFGLLAAKKMSDDTVYRKLKSSREISFLLVKEKIVNSILSKAILLNAETFKSNPE